LMTEIGMNRSPLSLDILDSISERYELHNMLRIVDRVRDRWLRGAAITKPAPEKIRMKKQVVTSRILQAPCIRNEKTITVRRAGRFGQRPGIDHLPRRDVRRPPIANLPKVVAVALDRLVRTERHLIVGRRLFRNRNDPGRQTVWPEDEMARPEIAMRPVPERRRNWRRVRTQFHRRGRLIYLQPRYLATSDGLQVL